MNSEGKTKRRGMTFGKTAATKKAIVKLTEDSKEMSIRWTVIRGSAEPMSENTLGGVLGYPRQQPDELYIRESIRKGVKVMGIKI